MRFAHDLRQGESTPGANGSSLRIIHLGKFFHPAHGGIERTVRSLAHAQARLGCSVRVICMDHERGRATRVERDGPVEVVRVRRAASFCKLDHCPDLPRRDPRFRGRPAAPAHPEPVDDPRADALRRSQAAGGEPSQRRRSSSGCVACSSARSNGPVTTGPGWSWRCRRPTSPDRRYLRRYADRVAVLPIGLDLAPFLDPAPEVRAHGDHLKRSYPGPLWFFCGRLVYYKGLETALLALRSVPGTLLIAGDGPSRAQLERFAARLDLKDRVRFLGKVASRRGPGRLLPGLGRLLVPLERTQRGLWAGASRGHGERLPGDQHRDPAQRSALGQPP